MLRETVRTEHQLPDTTRHDAPDGSDDLTARLLLEKYEPIAVVGMGVRFPGGSDSPQDFEEFLRAGRSGVSPLPTDRWDVDAFTPSQPNERGKIQTTGGGFLDQIDRFDAAFFNISPKEAQFIDPQQRLVLETAWHALEHANLDPTPLRRGNGGVYIGASSIDYALELDSLPYEALDGHLAAGITAFPLSGRLSYFLGWRGPSVSVDTACSSSLSALHMAVEGLRRRECDVALCGGVNALHHPRIMVMFSHGQMLAADGQCKTFDDAADGYVRAEGCGMLVLKRLSDAERDGNTILAVVRGTAIGQDGDSAGLTVPNGPAQELVIRRALAAARLTPGDIQYVEAHGTGTPLGDPIELAAINDVFTDSHTQDTPLWVASVKTNLGHMEPASGIVGVIKTVLQLQAGTIYPHLNLRHPSARIPWDSYPVRVPTTCVPWPDGTRRAVVNSFGFAGTIAAAVLEQAKAPAPHPTAASADPAPAAVSEPDRSLTALFTLSARNPASLQRQASRYQRFLADNPDVDPARISYTSNIGRAHFPHRLAGVVRNRSDLDRLLASALSVENSSARSRPRKISFLFSGQGSQYAGMGAGLYRRFGEFRRWVDECDELFARHRPESVRDLLLGADGAADLIDRTAYTQPALFTLEYALAQLWTSWGVRPNVLIGHSVGEVTAAAVAGIFDLPDAVALVAARSRLMQSVRAPGGMCAVHAPVEQVEPLLDGRLGLSIAAVNAPGQCVVSGARDQLADMTARLRERGVRVDPLAVSHAFHSPLMAEVSDEFLASLANVSFHEPRVPVISNVTGGLARFAEIGTADYWVRHIAQPVQFMAGLRTAERRGQHIFVEVGPSAALTALARQCLPGDGHLWVASMRRRSDDVDAILRALTDLYTAGVAVSWQGVHRGQELPRVDLPGYEFHRRRYWLPVAGGATPAPQGGSHHPLLGREEPRRPDAPAGSHEFAADYSADQPAYLSDHPGPDGNSVVPAGVYVELILALQDAVLGHSRATIHDLRLHEPLPLSRDEAVTIRTRLTRRADGCLDVEVVSGPAGEPRLHASALVDQAGPITEGPSGPAAALLARAERPGGILESADGDDIYTDLTSVGRPYGKRFRLVTDVRRQANGMIIGELANRPSTAVEHLPPEVVEAMTQIAGALHVDGPVLAPISFGQVRLLRKPRADRLRVLASLTPDDAAGCSADMVLLDGDTPVAELIGTELRPIKNNSPFTHRLEWVHEPTPTAGPPVVAPRHVLLLGGWPTDRPATPNATAAGTRRGIDQLVAQAAEHDIRVTPLTDVEGLAAALDGPAVTDVCWHWHGEPEVASADRLRAQCERNYSELLQLVATLTGTAASPPPRLWLVTTRAQWLPDDQPGTGEQLAAATLWGFGHVLLNENPRYRTTLVDLTDDHDLADLLAGWREPEAGEFQLAFRGGRRYVRRLLADREPDLTDDMPVKTPTPAPPEPARPTSRPDPAIPVRPDRVYLVTGGLGGLGLATARMLVDQGATRLVLASRGGQPATEAAGILDELSARAEVHIVRADLGSTQDVQRIAEQVTRVGAPLGGIVHAAGSAGTSHVTTMTWEMIDDQLRASVYGGWLLHELGRQYPELDFFCVHSSIAAVVGGATQAHYAAGFAFLDGLVTWRARQGLPGLTVNWGAWSRVGMSARLTGNLGAELQRSGIRYFSPVRALRTLRQLLGSPVPVTQRIVGEFDWQRHVAQSLLTNALYSRLVSADAGSASGGYDLTALLAKPSAGRREAIGELVLGSIAAAMHLDEDEEVEPSAEFVALGLDSLMALEVRKTLEAALRIALPATLTFDHPTPTRLAEFLDGQLAPQAQADRGHPVEAGR